MRWLPPEWHESVGSTNTLALADPRPGRVVVAEHQSAGQGRRARTWTAPPGTSLAVTAVVPAPPADRVGWVPLVAGLAVLAALRTGPDAVPTRLKWPNDVLVADYRGPGHRKVCGILAQADSHPEHGRVVAVGTGLNVDQLPGELPVASATSWRLARAARSAALAQPPEPLPQGARQAFVTAYLDGLAELLERLGEDPRGVREDYRRACDTLGRRVRVHLPGGGERVGAAVDVAPDGALVVDDGRGRHAHHAGDVVHVRPLGQGRPR